MAREVALANIRTRLEEQRQSLQRDIEDLVTETQSQQDDSGVGNHVGDDASELFERERNLALRSNVQSLLDQVELALHRLDEGSYGICARCGKEIGLERLEAHPSATFCITCQSEVEHQR